MWKFKDGFSNTENMENAKRIKSMLEALKTSINEIIEINVHINPISSGYFDIFLDSRFENEKTMAAYKVHPEHIKASNFITSVLQDRTVFDCYE